jgi:DNA-binding MarR family transcriptional regulator
MTILPGSDEVVKDLTTSDRLCPPGHTALGDRTLGDLMRTAQQTLVRYLDDALREAGYDDLGAAHASVLNAVDAQGTRLATLVDRVGRTKQATAELAGRLVARGYLELEPDPTDGRAKLYRPTAAGSRALAAGAAIVGGYENWLDDLLGADGVARLRTALTTIVEEGDHRRSR